LASFWIWICLYFDTLLFLVSPLCHARSVLLYGLLPRFLQIDTAIFGESTNYFPGFLLGLATTATPSISSSSSISTARLPRRTRRAFRLGAAVVALISVEVAWESRVVAGDAAREDKRDRVVEREPVAAEAGAALVERLVRDRARGFEGAAEVDELAEGRPPLTLEVR